MSCPAHKAVRRAVCLVFLISGPAWAANEDELFFKGTSQVNDGELRFLTSEPERPVHHHHNRLTITRASLETGWVQLEQCHSHLDPVPRSQIMFRRDGVRALRVIRREHIERAWVEGHSVQMVNVAPGARLCLEAETRALTGDAQTGYQLRNGPFLRRFLDGYYPMRVSQEVILATPLLFLDLDPAPQPGLRLELAPGLVRYEALFEGQLRTTLRFALPTP